MKKQNKAMAITVSAALAAACALTGCSGGAITLTRYDEALDMHTDLQKQYILNTANPADLDPEVDGLRELSRPKPITLTWSDAKGERGNYAVEISESRDMKDSMYVFSDTNSADVYNLKIDTTYYWRVRYNVKGEAASEVGEFKTVDYGPRNLYVDGVTNVRDTGGWKTVSGERTVQGLLYRGGRLNNSYPEGYKQNSNKDAANYDKNVKEADRDAACIYEREITDAGAEVFTDVLHIKTEIDLRENHANGYPRLPSGKEALQDNVDGVTYVPIPMDGSADINDNLAAVRKMFDVLAEKDNYPIYFHCNIGTDRTGMMAFVIGALCGLGEDTLYRDYMFSDFGTIATAEMAWNAKLRSRVEVSKIAESKNGGIAYRFSTYPGETMQEKAVYCLAHECGVPEDQIEAVQNILLGRA